MHEHLYTLHQIAEAMHATLQGDGLPVGPFRLLTDSRTLNDPLHSIFFALKTRFNDGHRYIPELIEKGVRIFVCDKNYRIPAAVDCHFLVCEDPLHALQELAAAHRKQFHIPVAGITGSNGKTIVKEWLLQLLGNPFRICANPKSYNSQIGVPLSVWQLNPDHELGIFEAGISAPGEMEKLERIIRPEIGILTHLGTAHNEGFDDPARKLEEKLKLFENCHTVLTQYQPAVTNKIKARVLSFGFEQSAASLNISETVKGRDSTLIRGDYQGLLIEFTIPFTDDASIENACLCALCCLYFDHFDPAAFAGLTAVSMRMELKKGIHNCILVNDSYSNDLNALSTALSFLQQQAIHEKTTVILSDIEESGLPGELLYKKIRNLLLEKKVRRIIGIGPDYMQHQDLFSAFEHDFYTGTQAFLDDFYKLRFHDESILIKGARRFGFEAIVRKLEKESHGTVLEINLSAAMHNLNAIRGRLPAGMKIMAMVKAFAYGSGSYEMAKLLQNKVDYLAVAYTDEGIALRHTGIQTPIMVLNADQDNIDQLTENRLEPVLFSLNQAKTFLSRERQFSLSVHIEIDTGMHRLGFSLSDIPDLCTLLLKHPQIRVASVFSHLAASDESRYDDFSKKQFDDFRTAATEIENKLGPTLKHISNTAASLRFSQDGLDMVRLGIGIYGIDPTGQFGKLLEPVFTLKTHISQIKNIDAHESIGYSRQAISGSARRIAVLALGYADGLNRALSNGKGGFYIRGQFAPVTGNICMDMCMVDITHIECAEGDEAILFGKDHPIADLAATLHTIPYEILTSVSQRVKRVYVSE